MNLWRIPLLLVLCGSCLLGQVQTHSRKPSNEKELKFWLQNMVWYHQFTTEEIELATGLSPSEIQKALEKFRISRETRPRQKNKNLLVLPYPGGRHPRIGFLDGAVDPQRETK